MAEQNYKLRFEKLLSLIVCLLVMLGPVYWFGPSAHASEIGLFKTLLFIVFIVISFLICFLKRKFFSPSSVIVFGFLGSFFFLLISMMRAQESEPFFGYISGFGLSSLTLFFSYNLTVLGFRFDRSFKIGVIIFACFSIILVSSFFLGFPVWSSPFGDLPGERMLVFTGFGGSRTGWGVGVALLVPYLFYFLIQSSNFSEKAFFFFLMLIVFIGLVSTQGRGGFISSLVAVFVFLLLVAPRKKIQTIIVLIVIVIGGVIVITDYAEHLRLEGLLAGDIWGSSGGRMPSNMVAFDLAAKNVLFGSIPEGIDLTHYGFAHSSIHNFWLRLLLQGGLFFMLPSFIMYLFFIYSAFKNYLKNILKLESALMLSMLIAGFFVTMLEPGGVFGAFFNVFVFWFYIGVYFAKIKLSK